MLLLKPEEKVDSNNGIKFNYEMPWWGREEFSCLQEIHYVQLCNKDTKQVDFLISLSSMQIFAEKIKCLPFNSEHALDPHPENFHSHEEKNRIYLKKNSLILGNRDLQISSGLWVYRDVHTIVEKEKENAVKSPPFTQRCHDLHLTELLYSFVFPLYIYLQT